MNATLEKTKIPMLDTPEAVMARAMQMSRQKLIALNGKLLRLASQSEADKPKVLFADAVSSPATSVLVGDLAKILRQNGVEIGARRLFELLRSDGWLIKHGDSRNMPTQRAMEMGLMEIKETTAFNRDGSVRTNRTPKVTGKGQVYFVNYFLCPERRPTK